MKKTLTSLCRAAMLLSCAAALSACGGGGDSSSEGSASLDGGLAPAHLSGDIRLTPIDANVHGTILLTDTPARVAYFNDGTTSVTTTGAYTGNYTYTKCGPNMVQLKMDNVRYEPIETASDCHWTIIGYLNFVEGGKVVFTGTETLVGQEANDHNDPFGFGALDGGSAAPNEGNIGTGGNPNGSEYDNDGAPNHFGESNHDNGGTRNFSLNYTFTMGN